METIIRKIYPLLLADPEKDIDYTKGNRVDNNLVYDTALNMSTKFNKLFNHNPISSACSLYDYSTWHTNSCTIIYETKRDREIPNRPLCFGYLTIVGESENIDELEKILLEEFPEINKLSNEYTY